MTRSAKRRAWREKQKEKKPYTKGRALIDARAILGPDAHVRLTQNGSKDAEIGRFTQYGFIAETAATTFREAIAMLRKQQDAKYLGATAA